jgi:hypothetical protein
VSKVRLKTDPTLQAVLEHLNNIGAGQEKLKKDIRARQEELKINTSCRQEELNVVSTGHNKVEEQLKKGYTCQPKKCKKRNK